MQERLDKYIESIMWGGVKLRGSTEVPRKMARGRHLSHRCTNLQVHTFRRSLDQIGYINPGKRSIVYALQSLPHVPGPVFSRDLCITCITYPSRRLEWIQTTDSTIQTYQSLITNP